MSQIKFDPESERSIYRVSIAVSVFLAVLLLVATIALLRANM